MDINQCNRHLDSKEPECPFCLQEKIKSLTELIDSMSRKSATSRYLLIKCEKLISSLDTQNGQELSELIEQIKKYVR